MILVWCVAHGRLIAAQRIGGVVVLRYQLGAFQVVIALVSTVGYLHPVQSP